MKIAILGSTRGTDMEGITDALQNNQLENVEMSFVLSNKQDAYILERARNHGFKAIFLDPKGKKREEYDEEITQLLEEHQVDLILLIGYMKLMSVKFVDRWLNQVMNIHPSLLPAFAGGMDLNVHQAVLDRGCKISGATLMFIDHGADTGPIILQGSVPVEDDDSADSLKDKVQAVEKRLIVEGIRLYRDARIEVVDQIVRKSDA